MPIPTDTFWNIKKLNVVFALSAIALFLVTAWAIVQDYSKDWRDPQRQARVWDAALTTDKIKRDLTPKDQQELSDLDKKIADTTDQVVSKNKSYQDLVAEKKQIDSDRATLEFRVNNLKSNIQVWEANLQDAIAAGDETRIRELNDILAAPHKQFAEWTLQLEKYSTRLAEIRNNMEAQTADLDALRKQRNQLVADRESLQKKLGTLQPNSLLGKISSEVRDAPLMGFVNPPEKVQQIVLPDVQTDVAFMKITTIDRCTTCHINISNKDFTEENVLAYLEQQIATVRKLQLPEIAPTAATAPSATLAAPGPAADTDFWQGYAQKVAPDQFRRNLTRINNVILRSINGTVATVTYGGQPLTPSPFTYDINATDPAVVTKQNDIVLAMVEALARWKPDTESTATRGKAVATISKTAGTAANNPRNQALRYSEELRNGLRLTLPPEQWKELLSRYRYSLVDELNTARHQNHLPALNPSPVLLAHPQLDLYVDVDSPHSAENVGCTSCHDGSGQETDFVLAAHVARDIYVDAKTGAPVLPAQLKNPPRHEEKTDLSNMLAAAEKAHGVHFESAPSTQPQEDEAEAPEYLEYLDPASGQSGRAMKQFDYWRKTYEPAAPRGFALVYHEWDWPMRTPQYIEVNCARCHTDVYDIKETAPTLFEGRQLFTQMGCVNCHQMDSIPSNENRKVGTDLRQVTRKLSPEYINTWIWAPKAFRPTTKMPHFFMLENNSSDEELRRTRQEARAITEYLVRTATPETPKYTWPQSGSGNADNGKAIFSTIGCMACHQNLNERGEQWITTDLVKAGGMTDDQAKTAYAAMSYNERQIYVQQHFSELMVPKELPKYPDSSPRPVFVQVGPELSGIGTKLTAGRTVDQAKAWLFDWLKEPRHYSDYTIMPQLRLSDQQAMDLAEYLLAQKRTTTDPKDTWSAGLTPIDTQKLIELTAFQLKSRFTWPTALVHADDDAELNADAEAALTNSFTTPEQAKAEVAKMSKDEKRLVFLGQKMIANYSCMSCHLINGTESMTSPCPNLSAEGEKGVDKLDFGYLDHHKLESLPPTSTLHMVNGLSADASAIEHAPTVAGASAPMEVSWPHVDHSRDSWITQKVKNSRIYDRDKALLEPSTDSAGAPYDKLKMPTFYLNENQVHAIVTFVLSNRNRLISDKLTLKATNEQAALIARGRELTEKYNCVSCHQTEHNQPQIQQYFAVEDIPTQAPPSLRGEGNKIQFNWLFNFFKNVEQMRPLIFNGIRMPSFPARDDEWTAIIAYFNAISNKEAGELIKKIDPVNKYIETARTATTLPSDPSAVMPGDDWWQRREFASTADYLKQWGLTIGHIKPIQVSPGTSAEDLRKIYKVLLFKAQFTNELYTAPFPFVDSPRPQISDERFQLGERFFYEMQCLKCHVLGDPNAPGVNNKPTAPNLSLAFRRLQQRWVRRWVQEPGTIQINTAMPPFFTGLVDNYWPVSLHGQSWPRAQNLPEADRNRIEATYGADVETQTRLLLDFLYAAGVRGVTGVQPPTTAPASP